jgi:hypothetical protein
LNLADDAEDADLYSSADHLAQVALAYAQASPTSPVNAAARLRQKELSDLHQAYEPIQDAVRLLADKPTDPEANLALGKFYALHKGDWDRGLALLAHGNDAQLQALAQADLATPGNAAAAVELANRYKAQAASESGAAQINLLCRARYWYMQGVGKLSESENTRIVRAVAEIDRTAAPLLRPVILHARYGAYRGWADVTEKVRTLLSQSGGQPLLFKGGSGELGIGDPASGEHKSLIVVYRYRGGVHLSVTGDEDTARIPALPGSADTAPGKPAPGQELTVLYARFGNDNRYADATALTQTTVNGATLAFRPDQIYRSDPYPGRHKAFLVVYRDGGRVYLNVTAADGTANITAAGSPKP